MLVTFMTSGYPDRETFNKLLVTMDKSGADIIEIGIPFSDPLADGTVIQASSQVALQNGTNLRNTLQMIRQLKDFVDADLLIMSYYNPVLQYGIEEFIEDSLDSGISGVIIPDLPFDEKEPFYEACRSRGINTILMIAPTTPMDRAIEIARHSQKFLYCVSLIGITGSQKKPLLEWLSGPLQIIRGKISIPVVIGFGVDSPETARVLSKYADGIVVGSAIIRLVQEGRLLHEISDFVRRLKDAIESG